MNKIELREKCREIINGTPPERFVEWGEKISAFVLASNEWKNAETVFVFAPMGNEPDTMLLLLNAMKEGKRLCVPRITGDGTMEAVEIKNFSALKTGKFGIPEPVDGCNAVKKSEIDLILLPCFAADESGNRLGKGGGFYDRFCEGTDCGKIVICPELFLMKQGVIPSEEHDVAAENVATEKKFIRVRR